MKRLHHDYDLENLLDLNEVVYYIQKGKYWVKFEAKKVTPTKNIPHGIKYCLTLHDKDNKRILGYDNAHDCLLNFVNTGQRKKNGITSTRKIKCIIMNLIPHLS